MGLPVKLADDCRPCSGCGEPWCDECSMHYADCFHPGPHSEPQDEPMKKNPHAVALGRKGGASTSKQKAEAARKNGKKGGRPKKVTSSPP